MRNSQVDKDLSKHVKYFQGAYPIDLSPSTLLKTSIIVINLDKHYIPGSHWVAVCSSGPGYAEYFDSYVMPPYKLEIMLFLQRHSFFMDIYPLETAGTHLKCLRWLLLHPRSPQCQGTIDDVICEQFVLLATSATIKRQCACSALSFKSAPLAAVWSSSSCRASRIYK